MIIRCPDCERPYHEPFTCAEWSAKDPLSDEEIARFLRAFAGQQETTRDLAEVLLVYAQHYPSCDGQPGADGCCECGLSDWLAKARKLSPDGRGGDYLMWREQIAERDRTIEEQAIVEKVLRREVTDVHRTLKLRDQSELRLYEYTSELNAKLEDYNEIANRAAIVRTYEIESESGRDVPKLSRAVDLTVDRLVNAETEQLRAALAAAEEKLEACESRRTRLESQLLSMPPDSGDVGQVRYTTDDIDIDEDALELVIHNGRNGDWYVAVVPQGVTPLNGVRITTSGIRVRGLAGAVADAYRAIAAAGDRAVLPRRGAE